MQPKSTEGTTTPRDVEPPVPPRDRGFAARLNELERENVRLRRIVADKDLEIEMLRELSRGTY